MANSPPIVIHTVCSISILKKNRCVIHTESQPCGSKRGGTRHDDDVGVFSRCFPSVPPVNLNPRIIYNHMDADKVMSLALNYIIT